MRTITSPIRTCAAVVGLVVIGLLAGCGSRGSTIGSTSTSTGGSGGVAVNVAWPTSTSRLIPAASNSIKLQLTKADGTALSPAIEATIDRPQTTCTLTGAPVGSLLLKATAHPQTGGLGTAQASGQKPVTIYSGQNTTVSLTLNTTITKVVIAPATTTVAVGAKTTLAATAQDASGTTVLVPAASGFTWAVTAGDTAATVDTSGQVTGLAAGTATVRATEKDSGQSATAQVTVTASSGSGAQFTIEQTMSDQAQRTTLAFSGLALMTGNLEAQSFFPPGKVADYTGFQYLRDNDPDNMGHNTSFLTRVANNVIYILNDTQFAQLKTLAVAQMDQINQYGYQRYPLMKAFRRLLDGDVPSGTSGLSLSGVKAASRALYLIDGQISFDRALLYANILRSLDSTQTAYLAAMKGKGWKSWPDITNDQIRAKMQGLPQGTAVAVMTYASDLFSWYAGSVEADVYFCPERHGTYYGGFYIKDAPAIGHEGYSIDEQLTATAGSALCDPAKGYVTASQAATMSSLVDTQRTNLTSIVTARTQIATLLRGLLTSTANSDSVKAQVLALSGTYGDLDGENNYHYATVFAQVYQTLTAEQRTKLLALRQSILSGTYADGTPFDFTTCTTPFLYSAVVSDQSVLAPYVNYTDSLFQ